MDNKQIFHIAGEVIVVGCISLYFIKQLKKLHEEIDSLKDELKSHKDVTNRNFSQIYAIMNSAFGIHAMPVQVTGTPSPAADSGSSSKIKNNNSTDNKSVTGAPYPAIETDSMIKEPSLGQVEDIKQSNPDQIVSRENFSVIRNQLPVHGQVTQHSFANNQILVPMFRQGQIMSSTSLNDNMVNELIIGFEGPRRRKKETQLPIEIIDDDIDTLKENNYRGAGYYEVDQINESSTESDEELQEELKYLGLQSETTGSETLVTLIGANSSLSIPPNNIQEKIDYERTQEENKYENTPTLFEDPTIDLLIQNEVVESSSPVAKIEEQVSTTIKRKKKVKNSS